MDVSFSAGDLTGGKLQDSCKSRRVQITWRADLNSRIAGLGDERRQPADLEFESDDDEQFGLGELQKKARLRIDKVRVLIASSDGFHFNLVTANFLRERRQVGCGGHDANFVVCPAGDGKEQGKHERQGRGARYEWVLSQYA